jgi:hypothetical protein
MPLSYFRVHYPLPLLYVGKADPQQLQNMIQKLKQDIKALKQQVLPRVVLILVSCVLNQLFTVSFKLNSVEKSFLLAYDFSSYFKD